MNKLKKLKNNFSFYLPLYIIILINLIIEIIQVYYDYDPTILIFLYNIQIFLLLFSAYKFLIKGLLVSVYFNLLNGVISYLMYLSSQDFFYVQIIYFRIVTLFLSTLIYYLSLHQKRISYSQKDSLYTDSLTGLFNHRYFYERLETEIKKSKRTNGTLGLVMVDIDNFKNFNDTFGHKAGDIFLKQTAKILQSTTGVQDIISRYEGDLFALILPYSEQDKLKKIAEEIKSCFALFSQKFLENKGYKVTLSIGYSLYPELSKNGNELISQVESALYNAKQTGKNNVSIYRDVFNNIKEYLDSTETQLLTSLKTLLGTVSAKDRYTLGHSERVMDYAVLIGTKLKLTDPDLKVLKIAALVHDVGKIEIPQDILNKRERLTNEEFSLIQKHPVYSAEIIKPLSRLKKLHEIVKHHHERFDGYGYPDGLKGEKILLETRILSVADSFDAMMSKRPYRNSLTLEEAKKELKSNSGSQFDSKIIQAFLEILERREQNERIS